MSQQRAPGYHPTLPRLPHARREIQSLADRTAGAVVLAGQSAKRSNVEGAKPGRFGVLHFATHARRGRMPALLLTPEEKGGAPSTLSPRHVMGLKLTDTRLVVLSACSTGRGRPMGTEGLIGLPRAFLIAGARRVVASVVEVVDDKTGTLMTDFHGSLRPSGAGNPARALLATQKRLLKEQSTSWPGYWGAFLLVGAP